MICGRLADGPIVDRRPDLPNSGHCEFVYLCARLYVTNGSSDHLFNIVIRIGARRDRRLCLFSNSVPMGCARRTECAVLAHAAFRRGAIQDGHLRPAWPPVSNPAPRPPLAAACSAAGSRFCGHAGPGHGAGGRFTEEQGGGRPRPAPSHQVLRAGGWVSVSRGRRCPAAGMAVWSLDGRRPRMGLPWRCRSGPGTATFLVRCRLRR